MLILHEGTQASVIDQLQLHPFWQALQADEEPWSAMVVLEPGDSDALLLQQTGCSLLRDLFDETQYGDADFAPSFDAIADHGPFYEVVYNLGDATVVVIVPKSTAIDSTLLDLCAAYSGTE